MSTQAQKLLQSQYVQTDTPTMGNVHIQVYHPPSQHAGTQSYTSPCHLSECTSMASNCHMLGHTPAALDIFATFAACQTVPDIQLQAQSRSGKVHTALVRSPRIVANVSVAHAPPLPGQSRAQCPAPPLPTHMRVSGSSLCTQVTREGSSWRMIIVLSQDRHVCTPVVHGKTVRIRYAHGRAFA